MQEENMEQVHPYGAAAGAEVFGSTGENSLEEKITEKKAFIEKTIQDITTIRNSLGLQTSEEDIPPSVALAREELAVLEAQRETSAPAAVVEEVAPWTPESIVTPSVEIQKPIPETIEVEKAPSQPEAVTVFSYDQLRENVVSGTATIEQVRDALVAIDKERTGAYSPEENLAFLQDETVKNTFLEDEGSIEKYNQLLSLTQFQCGQEYALKESPQAFEFLNDALDTAQKFSNPAWAAYLQGTILYLLGKQIPEQIIATTKGSNRIILAKFNEGLAQRGNIPLYKQDYASAIL